MNKQDLVAWTHRSLLLAASLCTAVVACSSGSDDDDDDSPPGDAVDPPPRGESTSFYGNFPSAAVSLWPPYTVARIERNEENTLPEIDFDGAVISEDDYVWDFWPVRNRDGTIAVIDNRVAIMGLTAPREGNIPGERHAIATWRWFYSTLDGQDWVDGGLVFPEGTALGDRQWAGSAVYDPLTSRIELFYTALGELPANPDQPSSTAAQDSAISRQEIAHTSAAVTSTPEGLVLQDFTPHELILTADGEFYATAELANETGALYVYRDPWYFEDPESNNRYLLFSATVGFQPGPKSGAVGIAVWLEEDQEWRNLSPLLAALETNSQLERPHIVYRDEEYYLFFSSHEFTFAEQDPGPEGLYGFHAGNLRGNYLPLNDGGLVLANPESAPLQTYSYTVLPGGSVLSFINYFDLGTVTLAEISEQSRQWQQEHFGGTPADPFFITIEGEGTRLLPPSDQPGLPEGEELLVRVLQNAEGQ